MSTMARASAAGDCLDIGKELAGFTRVILTPQKTTASFVENMRPPHYEYSTEEYGENLNASEVELFAQENISAKRAAATLELLEDDLLESLAELREETGMVPNKAQLANFRMIANTLTPIMALAQGIAFGATAEPSGTLSIVIQSFKTGRRVNFKIVGSEQDCKAITVDENDKATATPINTVFRAPIRRFGRWAVIGGAAVQEQ